MLVSDNKIKLSFVITFVIGGLLSTFFMTTRPQVFDILFVLLELYLLESYIKKNNRLYLIGLPIISLLMINLHASIWLMIFVVLIPYFIDSIVRLKNFEYDKYNVVYLGVITLIMFLVGLINPYGIDSFKYLFDSYGVEVINGFIGEMMPVTVTTWWGLVIFGVIFIVLLSYYYSKGKKIKLRYLLLFLGTCYLGLSHFKGVLFFLVMSILSLSYNFGILSKNNNSSVKFYENKCMNIFIVSLVILFIGGYGVFVYNYDLEGKNRNDLYELVNYLDSVADKDIKLYTGYDNGGYLQYRGYKTYIDPRAEVFLEANNKKEDIMVEYYNLQGGKINYKDFLDKYDFDYLLVEENDILYNYVDLGYEVVYENRIEDVNYRLYKRIDA